LTWIVSFSISKKASSFLIISFLNVTSSFVNVEIKKELETGWWSSMVTFSRSRVFFRRFLLPLRVTTSSKFPFPSGIMNHDVDPRNPRDRKIIYDRANELNNWWRRHRCRKIVSLGDLINLLLQFYIHAAIFIRA